MTDTIVALSSGAPPAAIAIVRVSGPAVRAVLTALIKRLPSPRMASLRSLHDADGQLLDRALVLYLPGPQTSTGEDVLELHCHGGRAVVDGVIAAVRAIPGVRDALPGEFTRRALENGIIDLAQAEGLADLLEAETQEVRQAALAASEGAVSRQLRGWMDRLSALRARVEVAIDYAEDGDVSDTGIDALKPVIANLTADMRDALAQPTVERLRDGPLVVLAGPRNAGKSSLFNALLGRDAAIVTPIAGTTRDVLETGVQRNGRSYRLVDTAGLVAATNDVVEAIGVARAEELIAAADLLLWFGSPDEAPARSVTIFARADERHDSAPAGSLRTATNDPATIERVWAFIEDCLRWSGATVGPILRQRHASAVMSAVNELQQAWDSDDDVIIAERLRRAAGEVGRALGTNPTEHLLDTVFERFCLGK